VSALLGTALAVMVAFARVYRGLHYPSDVFAGALLGLACLTIAGVAVRSAAARVHSRDAISADDERPGVDTVRSRA